MYEILQEENFRLNVVTCIIARILYTCANSLIIAKTSALQICVPVSVLVVNNPIRVLNVAYSHIFKNKIE